MKHIKFILFALVLGASTIMISSCGKDDPCKDVACGTNGSCAEGICICDVGYEKNAEGLCNNLSRDKFTGIYTGAETCTTGSDNYSITVGTSATGIDKVVLSNVYQPGVTLTGSVNGNALTIPAQTLTILGASYTFAGTGTYTAGNPPTLTISYTIQGTPSNSCTYNGSKQ